jgi:hypothetical protein
MRHAIRSLQSAVLAGAVLGALPSPADGADAAAAGPARSLQVSLDKTSLSVSPFEVSPPRLTASGVLPGDAIKVAIYWDLNRNGSVDAGEPLGALYRVVDGVVSKIGGVRNGNVPGDEDLVANGQIQVELRGNFLGRVTGVEGDALVKVWNEAAPSKVVYKVIHSRFPAQLQRISGSVVDTKDRPVSGAMVSLSSTIHGGGPVVFCFSDANGAYSAPVAPGSYRIDCWSTSHFHEDTFSSTQVDVNAGATVFTRGVVRDFVAKRTFTGTVVQTSGEAVPGMLLLLGTEEGKIIAGFSNETGRFSFNVEAEPYGFCPDESPFLGLSSLGLVANPNRDSLVDLTKSNRLNVSHPLAQKAGAMVYGKFKNDSGVALRGMTIRARNYTGGASYEDLGADSRVRADGSFWMATYPGTFELDLEDDLRGVIGCPYIYRKSTKGSSVTVARSAALNVGDVIAPVGTVTVKGKLLDSAGRPYPLLRYEGSWNFSFQADGSFAFKAFPSGEIVFQLSDEEGFGPLAQDLTVRFKNGVAAGTVVDTGTITVDPVSAGRPRALLQASSTVVTPGGSLRLSASAAGGGGLVYKWFKNGKRIAGASGSVLSLVGDTSAAGTAGSYYVEVSNAFGRTESNAVLLK